MKFRNKILLAIWGVVLGLLIIIFVIANYWMREQVEMRFSGDIRSNYNTVREIFSLRGEQDIKSCQIIAESPRLKAVSELGDKNTALQLSRELSNGISSDLFILTNSSGKMLAQLINGKEAGDNNSVIVSANSFDSHKPSAEIWRVNNNIYRGASAPVLVGNDTVGILTIGFLVTDEDVASIRAMTNSDVMLVADTSVVTTTSNGPEKGDLELWLHSSSVHAMQQETSPNAEVFTIKGSIDNYVAVLYRLNHKTDTPAIAYILTKPIGREVQESMAPVLKAFFVLSVVVLIVTVFIGFVISAGITRPIASLVLGTTEIAKGNYDYKITLKSGGELKFLAQKFEEMSEALKEKINQIAERNVELESTLNRLSNTEKRLQTILDTSSAIISLKDIDGKYILVNCRFESQYQFKREDVIGKTDYELFPKEIANDFRANDRKAIEAGGPLEWEEVAQQNETVHTYITNKFPLFDSSGVPYAVCGFSTDITDRKKLEDGLRQAQKMESIGTLAGGIAHDFNNILGIILGYISKIDRSSNVASILPESLDGLKKAAWRGAELVKQILTFARKTDVLLESVNLNSAVEEITKMLSETFPKTVVFKVNLERRLPSIIADTGQIQQTLLNLCVNARDAMPEGGTILISTRIVSSAALIKKFPDAKKNQYACIDFSDTGTGMDDATRTRIFEPFFTTKEIGRGTGLGLSVVFGIINSHHGLIDVESTVGRGTTFHLYFPIPPGFKQISKDDSRTKEPIKGGSETILLVEDEEILRGLVKKAIEEKGYNVITASDGVEAVNLFLQYKDSIALILCDMGLPRLGGWDFYKIVKEQKQNINIIFASGYFDPAVKTEMQRNGAVDFIQKPYDPDEVVRHIREVIDKKMT